MPSNLYCLHAFQEVCSGLAFWGVMPVQQDATIAGILCKCLDLKEPWELARGSETSHTEGSLLHAGSVSSATTSEQSLKRVILEMADSIRETSQP